MMNKSEQERRLDEIEQRLDCIEQELNAKPDIEPLSEDLLEAMEGATERNSLARAIKDSITDYERATGCAAPSSFVVNKLVEQGYERAEISTEIILMREQGEIYEPQADRLKTV